MKGIILAGGKGTRLYPLTISISKQLMPIYDKPMIYYPLSVLLLAGIREILIITTPSDQDLFKKLLGNGSDIGCILEYKIQYFPYGIAEAFIIGKDFIGIEPVALILGDNIFYGSQFLKILKNQNKFSGGIIFAYYVVNPERYGVVEFDSNKKVISIIEKPIKSKSNFIIPGLYFYDNQVVEFSKKLKPSIRGELEITDINKFYLEQSQLEVKILNKKTIWIDTGTFDALYQAGKFVKIIEKRHGFKIGCIEEIAYKKGFININQLESAIKKYQTSDYGLYLKKYLKNL